MGLVKEAPEIGSKWILKNSECWWEVKKVKSGVVYLGRFGSTFFVDQASMMKNDFWEIAKPYTLTI